MPSKDGRANAQSKTLRDVFGGDPPAGAKVTFDADEPIYTSGDIDDAIYLVESGQVKLFMSSAAGKDCLIAIYAPGEIFGESCFTGTMKRFESASAMRRTVVLRMTRREFTAEVGRASLTEALLQHLASRSAERQTAVFDLTTMDSERRLAKVLLQLGQKLGKAEGAHYLIEQRISQEELAQIVGTTRPRVTAFMQRFRALGIIDTPGPRAIRIDRQAARDFVHRGE